MISAVSIFVVIMGQVFVEYCNYRIDQQEGKIDIILTLLPSIINVVIIGILGVTYEWVSLKLAIGENHQYIYDLENSIIDKIYNFQFVNTYISNFVYIFYYQDFKKLQTNLVTVMVFKQIVFVLFKYYWLKISVRRKLRQIDTLFEEKFKSIDDGLADDIDKNDQLALANLRMHQEIERQSYMLKP